MKKIVVRLACLIPAAAAAGVLMTSSVNASRAELQGVGSPGLPPPGPKSCSMTALPSGCTLLSDGTTYCTDGTILTQ